MGKAAKKTAKDVVSKKLVTVSMYARLDEAKALMLENRVRHLPVEDDSSDIVGVISQRDIVNLNNLETYHVAKFMSMPVEYVNQNESLRAVIFKMLEKKISSAIIVDDEMSVVGIVTTDDILWCFADTLRDDKSYDSIFAKRGTQLIGDVAYRLSLAGV